MIGHQVRLPPYMDWAEQQAPLVMRRRKRQAAATENALTVLLAMSKPYPQDRAGTDTEWKREMAAGIRHILATRAGDQQGSPS